MDFFGYPCCNIGTRIWQPDRKLFPSVSNNDIAAPDTSSQATRNFQKHTIPLIVTESIIDLFEMVDIDH